MPVLQPVLETVSARPTLSLLCLLVALIFAASRLMLRALAVPMIPKGVPVLEISKKQSDNAMAYAGTSDRVIQEGYDQFSSKGKNYILRTADGPVFIAAPQFVDEIKNAPDARLDPMPINNRTLQVAYTLHSALAKTWYEFDVVKKQLTHGLSSSLPRLFDECQAAFSQELGGPAQWEKKVMGPLASRIVTRTANRIFFSKELAANEEFLQLSTAYTGVVFGGAHIIRQYPEFLAPLVVQYKTDIRRQQAIAFRYLAPLLKERLTALQKDKADKQETLVQWIVDLSPAHEKRDLPLLVQRLMHIIVSAVHTSAVSFLDMIYELALNPDIHDELREEILNVFNAGNRTWTKQSLSKLVKIDSFMRETARHHPFLTGSLERQAVQDFALTDGTVIPKGMKVSVPQYGMNRDEKIYGPSALEFDAFRFSRLRSEPGQELNHSYVQTSGSFIHFGHGKHACPGRFFASNELKVLLIYTLSRYEIRWAEGEKKPAPGWYGGFRVADMGVAVEYKVREKELISLDMSIPDC